ncbi:hypothetical protein CDV57_09730, partial [Aspergillus fumigatus]
THPWDPTQYDAEAVDHAANKLVLADASYDWDLLRHLLNAMRLLDDSPVQALLAMFRADCAIEEEMLFAAKTLKNVQDAGRGGSPLSLRSPPRMPCHRLPVSPPLPPSCTSLIVFSTNRFTS